MSLVLLAFTAMVASSVASADALDLAVGSWELKDGGGNDRGTFTCASEPLEISVDRHSNRYESKRGDFVTAATITRAEEKFFLIRYDDEERLDDDGKPLVWIWLPLDDDTFVWARLDGWLKGERGTTSARVRCKG